MHTEITVSLRLEETCRVTGLESGQVMEIVELGIVEPVGSSPSEWQFDPHMVSVVNRARRLQHDLHIEWCAVAVVLDLLDERDRLRDENARLRQRLSRFLSD